MEKSTSVARRLEQVREIAGAVNASSDLSAILDQIVFSTCHHASWWTSGIMALNRANGYSELVTRYTPPGAISPPLPTRWSLDTSPSRLAVERRQPIIIPDAQTTTEYPGYRGDAIARDYHTVVVVSLNVSDADGRDLVLAVHSKEKIEVGKEELDFLSTISHLAAIAVNKAKLVAAERAYSARLKGVLDLSSTLFERVLEGGRMDVIASLIEATLLHPLSVVDFTTDRIYASRAPDGVALAERQWGDLIQGEGAPVLRNLVRTTMPSDFRTTYSMTIEGVVLGKVHVEPIRIDDETVGGLVIFPSGPGLSDLDILVAQNAKFALSTLLIRSHVAHRQLFAQVSDLLERAIDGRVTDEPAFRARAAQLGWSFRADTQLLLVDPTVPESTKMVDLGPYRALERELKRLLPSTILGAVGGQIVIGFPADDYIGNERLRKIMLAAVETTLKRETGHRPGIVEFPPLTSVSLFAEAYRSCVRTLTLARMFGRHGLVNEKDFGPYALLISALDDDAIPAFIGQTVGGIKTYDRQHETEFLKTSAVFIEQNCGFRRSAEVLGIHVSTLRYRIRRIGKVFGIDLKDAETRFALGLALRLDEMQRSEHQRT